MNIFITTISLILLTFIILNFYQKENFNSNQIKNVECHNNNINDTHVVEAPNIPADWRCKFRIGGKYSKNIGNQNIAPLNGKYVFPIEKLLYDGIFNSNRKINGNIETQNWLITKGKPYEGYYATNKFHHVPINYLDREANDTNIYYEDLAKLEIQDRNEYELDKCSSEKYHNHIEGIVYWPSGLCR